MLLDTLPAQAGPPTSGAPQAAIAARAGLAAVARAMARSLREHSLLIATVVVYCAVGRYVPIWMGIQSKYADHLYSGIFFTMTAVAGLLFCVAYAIHLRLVIKPSNFVATLKADIFGRCLTLRRIAGAAPMLLLLPFFGATFTNLKILIPAIQPFSWDPAFAAWDRLLHGGYDPWELLQPILGLPPVTSLINAIYHSWFFVAYGVVLWQIAHTTRPQLRMRYLLTFLLIWAVIGNAAAAWLSSAGPVYFGRVTGLPDPFAPLMHYLYAARDVVPVPALGVQEGLWKAYAAKGLAIGGGISAMPSLHVAVAFSFVLLARGVDRRLAAGALAYAALILIGSVHLGWHYALDGYVAILLTWLIWRAVGWLLGCRSVARLLWGGSAAAAPAAADHGRPATPTSGAPRTLEA